MKLTVITTQARRLATLSLPYFRPATASRPTRIIAEQIGLAEQRGSISEATMELKMERTLASLESDLNAVVTKGMRLEAVLAKVLVREAVTASLLRHGGQVSQILMNHVASAVRAYEVDAATPLFVVIDQDTGRERPGVTIDDLVYECRLSRDFSAHFKSPAGGGAKTRRPLANNPWNLGPSFNVAEQARLLRTNPGLAARLIQEAERSLYGILPAADDFDEG